MMECVSWFLCYFPVSVRNTVGWWMELTDSRNYWYGSDVEPISVFTSQLSRAFSRPWAATFFFSITTIGVKFTGEIKLNEPIFFNLINTLKIML